MSAAHHERPTALSAQVAGVPRRHAELAVGTFCALVVVLFGLSALDRYNITWDEALGDLFFGERYLFFFATLDTTYLDFGAEAFEPPRDPDLGVSPFRGRPWEYYPVANTLAAASAELFGRQLGWVDVFDGFHLLNLALAALLIVVMVRVVARRWGLAAGAASVGLLFGAPRIVAHMMANIKDFPLMVFFALTAFAFVHAFERGSVRGLLGAGVLLGLTLGTKANALFFPLLPALVLLFGGVPPAWRGRVRTLLAALVGAGAVSLVVLFAVWPYLWLDPLGHALEHIRYIAFRKDATRPESFAPALAMILWTTPPSLLVAWAVGLVPAIRAARRGDRLALAALVWPLAVMSRYALPQAVNFDGVRHFLEIFPALAVVGGLGVAWVCAGLVRILRERLPKARVQAVVATLVLAPCAWAVLATHPFQLCYWNGLVGGYGGARAAGLPQASDYWGASYRLGLEWLDEHAAPNAALVVPVVEHAVRLVAPERLRGDLQLLPITTPFSPRIAPERLAKTLELARTRPLYVMMVDRRDWRNVLMEDVLARLEPEVEWRLDGAQVLAIYRYHPPPLPSPAVRQP
ncbi:MAG: glycosyltransferase family 39 protein [Acidobacteriota bacterium]